MRTIKQYRTHDFIFLNNNAFVDLTFFIIQNNVFEIF